MALDVQFQLPSVRRFDCDDRGASSCRQALASAPSEGRRVMHGLEYEARPTATGRPAGRPDEREGRSMNIIRVIFLMALELTVIYTRETDRVPMTDGF